MFVLQMHGEPGSGKSTLARAIGQRTGAVVLDKDVIKAALLRTGIAESAAAGGAYEAYFGLARHLVKQGHSVILDNPVYWESVESQWRTIAAGAGSPALMIECVLRDRDELRRRLAAREGLESQPREPLDLRDHPGSIVVDCDRLTLETSRPLAELVEDALAYIGVVAPGQALGRPA
jgi:predicted kinase